VSRVERWAGFGVVLAIFISALVALGQTVERFVNPRTLSHFGCWRLQARTASSSGTRSPRKYRRPLPLRLADYTPTSTGVLLLTYALA
jgi:hypothetical protein